MRLASTGGRYLSADFSEFVIILNLCRQPSTHEKKPQDGPKASNGHFVKWECLAAFKKSAAWQRITGALISSEPQANRNTVKKHL
jgi:hypothetical protein